MAGISFLREGLTNPELEKVKYSHYPCLVTLNGPPPALNEAEALIASTQKESLSERVKPVPSEPSQNIVDRFFLIKHQTTASRQEVLRGWTDLTSFTQKIVAGTVVAGLCLTVAAVYGAPIYIEVVLLAGIVASCCLFGWSLQRYYTAEKELKLWIHPGEDFALRRKADLELSLDNISKQKCHYHPDQPEGTLLGIEIYYLFKKHFQQFAEPLLTRKCDTPSLQHKWVFDFYTSNPLMIEFFKDNPHLEKEEEWKAVKPFHLVAIELMTHLDNLNKQYYVQFSKDLEAVRKKLEDLGKDINETISKVSTNLALDAALKDRFQNNLILAFNDEFFSKVSALAMQHRTEGSHFASFVYPQIRKLLEMANTRVLKDEPVVIDPAEFSFDKKPAFSEEYRAIATPYPNNVLDRAKSLDADVAYQNFIQEVFNNLKPFDKVI